MNCLAATHTLSALRELDQTKGSETIAQETAQPIHAETALSGLKELYCACWQEPAGVRWKAISTSPGASFFYDERVEQMRGSPGFEDGFTVFLKSLGVEISQLSEVRISCRDDSFSIVSGTQRDEARGHLTNIEAGAPRTPEPGAPIADLISLLCTDRHTIVHADIPADAPRFEDFKVPVYVGPPARPDVRSDSRSRLFRTELREAEAEGTNFAGHYRLASWGCGTACFQWAIIDVKSGRVFHPSNLNSTEHQNVEESLYEGGNHAIQVRLNSRLLVVFGGINDDPTLRGISWFVWEGNQLKRIRFVAKPY